MSTAIDMYFNQIFLTGGILFDVTLQKEPQTINADLMTTEEIYVQLPEGYDDMKVRKAHDAVAVSCTEKYHKTI